MAHKEADRAYVGIRVPGPIKRAWEEKAKKEQRSLSNWILHSLEAIDHPSSNKRPATSN